MSYIKYIQMAHIMEKFSLGQELDTDELEELRTFSKDLEKDVSKALESIHQQNLGYEQLQLQLEEV